MKSVETSGAVPSVTLETCDREPIHIPGQVQPHGAMLAFDDSRRLRWRSSGADALLGGLPMLGEVLEPAHFGKEAEVHDLLAPAFDEAQREHALPLSAQVEIRGRLLDLIVHRSDRLVVVEFEPQASDAALLSSFALKAHRAMDRLKRQRSADALLAVAVEEVRKITGFDRVMAYRFRHDDSGDVVAEACDPAMEPFAGRRYPAGDIPAQARRLYVVNTLRLIADVAAVPVALESADREAPPLDMSQSVLRAVSPIHIEYLTNMGVGASMSVSIVVQGRLWGMLACHHRTAYQVPYAIRMACDVIAQLLAANVQMVVAREQAERIAATASLQTQLSQGILQADDVMAVLAAFCTPLQEAFGAHAVILADGGKLVVEGGMPLPVAQALLGWLNSDERCGTTLLHLHSLADFPPALQVELSVWCGVLALCIDPIARTWIVLARKEQIETVSWGGKPEKEYAQGPLGQRLTPRGSFAVWRETVRGTAVPWSDADRGVARSLLDELTRITAARFGEMNRARNELLAVLGHDLRDPLHSISMAAQVLERGSDAKGGRLGQRIQSSSNRMQRLVGQVLDMSRLQGGLGLGLQFVHTPLGPLVHDLLEEAEMAHPGTVFDRRLTDGAAAAIDADRIAQVVANLVSNARHHGALAEPIVVALKEDSEHAELQVRNVGQPIPEDLAAALFSPFKRQSLGNERNRGGLGLGLYIAHQIVEAHGGSIVYSFEEPHVVFTVRLPRAQPAPD